MVDKRMAKEFIIRMIKGFINAFKDLFFHLDGIILLILATIGLSSLLVLIPLTIQLPFWIESTMIMPAIATLIVFLIACIPPLHGEHTCIES